MSNPTNVFSVRNTDHSSHLKIKDTLEFTVLQNKEILEWEPLQKQTGQLMDLYFMDNQEVIEVEREKDLKHCTGSELIT